MEIIAKAEKQVAAPRSIEFLIFHDLEFASLRDPGKLGWFNEMGVSCDLESVFF